MTTFGKSIAFGFLLIVAIVAFIILAKPFAAEAPAPIVATTTPSEVGASSTKVMYDAMLGIEYSYIDNFYIDGKLTEYVRPQEWPPRIDTLPLPLVCDTTPAGNPEGGKTETKIINGTSYCYTKQDEGAAGSTYTTYTIRKEFGGKVLIGSVVVRYPQCANYDEPKQTACKSEQATFNIDLVMDRILSSVVFK
jgi:hypothetical protein